MNTSCVLAVMLLLTGCAAPHLEIHSNPQHAEVYRLTGQQLQRDSQLQILFRGLPDVSSLRDFDGRLVQEPVVVGGKAVYPLMARVRNQEGRFVIAVLLDVEGKPVTARALDSSNEALTEAALDQAMHTRWSPALVDGIASPYITIFKPVFKLY